MLLLCKLIFEGKTSSVSVLLAALVLGTINASAMADVADTQADLFRQQIVEAIKADSLVWDRKALGVAYQMDSADQNRGQAVVEYVRKALTETFGAVGISVTEVDRDPNINIFVTDVSNTYSLPNTSSRPCSFKLNGRDGTITRAEATIVLGFASPECVRVLALNIAGLSGTAVHNVRGTLLSNELVSATLTETDRSLIRLLYASSSSDSLEYEQEYSAVSKLIVEGSSTVQSLQWSKELQAALDGQSTEDQKKHAYAAFRTVSESQSSDFYRLGVTFLWLSVLDSPSGQLSEAIKNATASVELLQKNRSPEDEPRLYSIEVNLTTYHTLNGNQEYCAAKRDQIEDVPETVGNVVRATARYVLAFCDSLKGNFSSAFDEIEASMQACIAAYFGACPSWEVSYVFAEVSAARGELESALQRHVGAKQMLQRFSAPASACSDLQHIRQRIAQLSYQVGKVSDSKAMAAEALGDGECYQSLSPDAISRLRRMAQEQ